MRKPTDHEALGSVSGVGATVEVGRRIQFFVEKLDHLDEKTGDVRGLMRMGDGHWILIDGVVDEHGRSLYRNLSLLVDNTEEARVPIDVRKRMIEMMDRSLYENEGITLLDLLLNAVRKWISTTT